MNAAERELHARRRRESAERQEWRCERCRESLEGALYDVWRNAAYHRGCRLRCDAAARVAKGLETKRQLRLQTQMFPGWRAAEVRAARRRQREERARRRAA